VTVPFSEPIVAGNWLEIVYGLRNPTIFNIEPRFRKVYFTSTDCKICLESSAWNTSGQSCDMKSICSITENGITISDGKLYVDGSLNSSMRIQTTIYSVRKIIG